MVRSTEARAIHSHDRPQAPLRHVLNSDKHEVVQGKDASVPDIGFVDLRRAHHSDQN